jgi:hypothetical protein
MMSKKDTNQQWELFSSGATYPLLRIIDMWASEDGVTKEEIIKRLSSILIRSNEYVMVWKNLSIEDPNVSHMLEKVLKNKTWKDIGADFRDRDLLKSFYGRSNTKVSRKLTDSAKRVLAKDLSVDCEALFEVIAEYGLPIPNFLRLIVGEHPGKPVATTTNIVVSDEPTANKEQPLLSVKEFCVTYPSFKEGGIRHYIFHEHTNGLSKSGGVVRIGKKVMVNVEKFFWWVNTNGKNAG